MMETGTIICKICKKANALTALRCGNCQNALLPELERKPARAMLPEQPATLEAGIFDQQNMDNLPLLHQRGLLYVIAEQLGDKADTLNLARQAISLLSDYYYKASFALEPRQALTEAFHQTNQSLYQRYRQLKLTGKNYGVICAATVVHGQDLITAHLGDQRVYLLRQGQISPLTLDHSWVRETGDRLLQEGEITPSEYADHKLELTRCLGRDAAVFCDTGFCPLENGDRFLLCNRAVWQNWDENKLALLLDRAESVQSVVDKLLQKPETQPLAIPAFVLATGSYLDDSVTRRQNDFFTMPENDSDPTQALISTLQAGEYLQALPALREYAVIGNLEAGRHSQIVKLLIEADKGKNSNNIEQLARALDALENAVNLIAKQEYTHIYPLAHLNLRGLYLRLIKVAVKATTLPTDKLQDYWAAFLKLAQGDFTAEELAAHHEIQELADNDSFQLK